MGFEAFQSLELIMDWLRHRPLIGITEFGFGPMVEKSNVNLAFLCFLSD